MMKTIRIDKTRSCTVDTEKTTIYPSVEAWQAEAEKRWSKDMCNCIDITRKELKEQTKDNSGILKNVSYMFSGGEILGTTFLYNARKKDGTKSKKLTTEIILFAYCPFCGKEYKE